MKKSCAICPAIGTLIPVLAIRDNTGHWRDFPLTSPYCSACAVDMTLDAFVGKITPPHYSPTLLWRVIELYFENKSLGHPKRAETTLRWITSQRFVVAMEAYQEPIVGAFMEGTKKLIDDIKQMSDSLSDRLYGLIPEENTGHGHVYPRADGVRENCGGPGPCKDCSNDFHRYSNEMENSSLASPEEVASFAKSIAEVQKETQKKIQKEIDVISNMKSMKKLTEAVALEGKAVEPIGVPPEIFNAVKDEGASKHANKPKKEEK